MSGPLNLLYFGGLADQLRCGQEQVDLPASVTSVAELHQWLISRGKPWDALACEQVRYAVNQEIVKMGHPVQAGDEVAFFPPVTGG